MTKQLTRISIRSVVPVAAAAFFVLGVVTALMAAATPLFADSPVTSLSLRGPVSLTFSSTPPAYVLLLYPFLSAAAGSVFAALLAWLYNVLTRWVGPVRITLSD